ncbi:MAG: penicillin-binding protein 2 [Chloroflexota bacterium]
MALRASIIFIFAVLAGRLWYMQVVMSSEYKQQADTSKIRLEPVAALRGVIFDRNGRQLVFNAPSWDVTIVPHGVPAHPWVLYRRLSSLLHGDPSPAGIAGIISRNLWRSYEPVPIKASVSTETAMMIKQMHLQLPGVRADPSSVRQYAQQQDSTFSMSHILGYAGNIDRQSYELHRRLNPSLRYGLNDQIGKSGVEAALEPFLHGVNTNDQVMVDAGERPIRVLARGQHVAGDNVYLTIDAALQRHVAADLRTGLDRLGVREGVAVVEDVHTGAILSMVSLPSFDNNWFARRISQKRYNSLLADPAHPLTDLATAGQFPPGSTFKIITAAAALQNHVVDASTTVNDTGSIKLCSVYSPSSCATFYGWQASGLGQMNMVSALARSSDIYFYTVAGGNPNSTPCPQTPCVGARRIAIMARKFGLGSITHIEIPGEAPGIVRSSEEYGSAWHIGDTYNMAIGQGYDDATPLQMANITAAIANGGTLYRPRIIQRIVGRVIPGVGVSSSAHLVQPFVPSIVRRGFLDPGNIALIQEGMHASVNTGVNFGTSYEVQDPRIDAAGKTGTAESGVGKPPHAWWVGYAPFNNPKISVCVLVPYASSEGATAAAPIAHKIFEDYFHLKPMSQPGQPSWPNDVYHFMVQGGAQ